MKHQPLFDTRFFFSTAPLPCPYLPGRMERRVVTELIGRDAVALHEQLSLAGFRRSHGIAYVPACAGCDACKAVRVLVDRFEPSRSQRRVANRNVDIVAEVRDAVATHEQFQLFSAYQRGRHGDGDMSKMDFFDYQGLVEDTSVDTHVIEFRDRGGALVGACLTDRMANGLSAVYSFFDPAQEGRSLGSFMILWLIDEARRRSLDYVYLGFWISDCSKMAYKRRFQPMEVRTSRGWVAIDEVAPGSSRDGDGPSRPGMDDAEGSLSLGEIL
jgi:arginyl-tRNA--protein-N-Asp/Glu arginylyltransferase